MTTTTSFTAHDLLAAVHPFGLAVEGEELVFDIDPSTEMNGALMVLHTGVRALITRKPWYGCGSERVTAAPKFLDPDKPIPRGVVLLCVAGDAHWDRIDPTARIDKPQLFDSK